MILVHKKCRKGAEEPELSASRSPSYHPPRRFSESDESSESEESTRSGRASFILSIGREASAGPFALAR